MLNEHDTPVEIAYESLIIEERVLSIVHEGITTKHHLNYVFGR